MRSRSRTLALPLQPEPTLKRLPSWNRKYADAVNSVGAVYFIQPSNGSAAPYFKKAVALDETRPAFPVNLGSAWFGQNKLDRAIAEFRRALELDAEALNPDSRTGVTAQVSSPEERARYDFMLAKIYAQRGDVEHCLHCLKMAKEGGYRDLASVYKLVELSQVRQYARLSEIVAARS
jgi:tetratricopeptide (TPR) repeat protein